MEKNCSRPLDRKGKVYVAGHQGLAGSALMRRLQADGFACILTRTREELDLTRQAEVEAFFRKEKPDYVILAAAREGGICANQTYPADFLLQNLQNQCSVLDAAYKNGVKKLLFLSDSCMYPRDCPQPIREEYLLGSYPEQTKEAYALAGIAGLKMCAYYNRQYGTSYIGVVSCSLYGPEDSFGLEDSHVLPALLRKFHEAKLRGDDRVTAWGSGRPLREFLHADDLADACLFLMDHYEGSDFINVGSGVEVPISKLTQMLQRITGFPGTVIWDLQKPDGAPRRVLDSRRLRMMGWEPKIDLETGIRETYAWFQKQYEAVSYK